MAGTDLSGNFNATNFRAQIRQTMKMGLPNNVAYQPTFRWVIKKDFAIEDPAKRPYNWFNNTPDGQSPGPIADIQVPCAVDWVGGSESGTAEGFINEIGVTLTLLDEDVDTLLANGGGRMPDIVLLKGEPYNVTHVPAPTGLFDVDVWQFFLTAQDAA